MRRSLQDIASMIRDIPYHSPLPEDLRHLHCYVIDSGHCILAIPECLLAEAKVEPLLYEVPLPVRYVLKQGWRPLPGTDCITVPVPYDDTFGAVVPEGYDEFEVAP